jgi:hypothetical protein
MSEQQQRQDNVLDGYVAIRAEDGQRYLVPHFMIPATHQALNAYHQKLELDVCNADGGVSFVYLTSVEVKSLWLLPCPGRSCVVAAPTLAPAPAPTPAPTPTPTPAPAPVSSLLPFLSLLPYLVDPN